MHERTKKYSTPVRSNDNTFYLQGQRWGMSDAAGPGPGLLFSRYIKQHGEYCSVDYRGHATVLRDESEKEVARGYVDACCGVRS